MPNTESAKKRVRQTVKRTLRNKQRRSAMRTVVRNVNEAVAGGEKDKAAALLPEAYRTIDKCAKDNIIHANTAANKKARLTRRVNEL